MRKIDEWFARYGVSHRHPVNEAIHWLCVPLITWSVLAALWVLAPVAADVAIILAVLFYATLSLPIAIGMLAVAVLMLASLQLVPDRLAIVALGVFVVAWIGQFIGHHIEGRKPSFIDDVKFLLIGPAWLLGKLLRRVGIAY